MKLGSTYQLNSVLQLFLFFCYIKRKTPNIFQHIAIYCASMFPLLFFTSKVMENRGRRRLPIP